MYNINDVVVYENGGVCRIEAIGTPDFVKGDVLYYIMQPVGDSAGKLYVKLDNTQFLMRPVGSKKDVLSHFDALHEIPAVYNKNDKLRTQEFKDALHSCCYDKWLGVLKGITEERSRREADGKHLNMADEKCLAKVCRLLSDELSVACSIPREEAKERIKNAF